MKLQTSIGQMRLGFKYNKQPDGVESCCVLFKEDGSRGAQGTVKLDLNAPK